MYLGLDFGTSGARACVINHDCSIVHEDLTRYVNPDSQTPMTWREALLGLIRHLPENLSGKIQGIAVSGTSATVLLCDTDLRPVAPALMYSDNRSIAEAEELVKIAPPHHIACGSTSGLAKFLWLTHHNDLGNAAFFMHQADWLAALLTGQGGISDYHNALKTGYDAENLCWPDWVKNLPHFHLLPRVVAPGSAISTIDPEIARHFGLNPACMVHAGTTDSIAAFIASGLHEPGAAVTSLGTTLVLKLLSERRIEAAEFGIYSHRFGKLWLAGGASNAGGGILRHFFSEERLAELSRQINPEQDSPLDYYPLLRPGERFPINDPNQPPRLKPRPGNEAEFLHGLLQGLSRIESAGYAKLVEYGATPLASIATSGGGARNLTWQRIRMRLIGVPIKPAVHMDAAYGAALLAKRGKPD